MLEQFERNFFGTPRLPCQSAEYFDHLAALLAVTRQVPSVHEPLVPFAPVGDREARVLSAPEPLPAQRSECVWNPPKHTPLRCQLARPRLVCTSRQRRATVLSLSLCGGRTKDTRRLAATWGIGDIQLPRGGLHAVRWLQSWKTRFCKESATGSNSDAGESLAVQCRDVAPRVLEVPPTRSDAKVSVTRQDTT